MKKYLCFPLCVCRCNKISVLSLTFCQLNYLYVTLRCTLFKSLFRYEKIFGLIKIHLRQDLQSLQSRKVN